MHRLVVLPFLVAALAASAEARRGRSNDLVRVLSPALPAAAAAHPFVNLVVALDPEADRSTFQARLGGIDITPLFLPLPDDGPNPRLRAEAGPTLIHVNRRRSNRLRLEVRSLPRANGRRARDVDRVRFRADEVPNLAPAARIVAPDVVIPDVPLEFSGARSDDPEGDVITHHWDFGDGTTSTEPRPTHVFAGGGTDVTVRLTVDDGQATSSEEVTLLAVPSLGPGRTPGQMAITAAGPLEFGAVAPGAAVTQTFTVRNPDTVPTSQLNVRLGVEGAGFSLDPARLDLGAGGEAEVRLTFTPGPGGHRSATIGIVGSTAAPAAVRMLAHAYDGAGAGTGPLPTSSPLFFLDIFENTQGILPSGVRFAADNAVRTCQSPEPGVGTADLCVASADCATRGETCALSGTCQFGERNGQACALTTECPGGYCSSAVPFGPIIDLCGDGQGGLYLLSDGTFTDPSFNHETELTGQVLRLEFDAAGNRSVSQIVTSTTESTTQLACDGIPAAAGGELYIAEYRNVVVPPSCFRGSREALTSVRKTGGGEAAVMHRIDSAIGIPECEDYEPVNDLQVARDATAAFASFALGGLHRIWPSPLLIVPAYDEPFALHPDGSVVIVRASDEGPTGIVTVYKIAPEQAETGAPNLEELTPCATVRIPNNTIDPARPGRTLADAWSVDRESPGSPDGTILVGVLTTGGVEVFGPRNLQPQLFVKGTLAIRSPAASNACTVLGFVDLETHDLLTF
jgi:PKD repeat protein